MKNQINPPFTGKHPISFPFGAIPTLQTIIDMYASLGLVGHNGIDYQVPEGTKINACDYGIVVKIDTDINFGLYITIQHDWGKSIYAHLNSTNVKILQKVKAGKSIARSGKTGFTTGPHLHFGIKPHNPDLTNGYLGYIDPTPFFI